MIFVGGWGEGEMCAFWRMNVICCTTHLGEHVGQADLHNLVGSQRAAKLLALQHILARSLVAELGRA